MKIVTLLLLFLSFSALALETKNCEYPDRIRLQSFVDETPVIYDYLISKIDQTVEDRLDISPDVKVKLKKAKKTLQCAQRKTPSLTYTCVDERGYIMKTLPLVGREVKVTTHAIYSRDFDLMVGMIIHEATHKCGTNDTDYFWQNKKNPESNWKSSWENIASTYDFWAIYGFCIPEVDC